MAVVYRVINQQRLIVRPSLDRRQRLALSIGTFECVPPKDGERNQSPKRCVSNKVQDNGFVIVILIYRRHKPIDNINLLGS
jgi:hypothetical protein